MDPNSLYNSDQFWEQIDSCHNITQEYLTSLITLLFQSDRQNRFSEPMPWIGMYIAIASLFCILAMVADLLHGLKNKKLWFPCKYFTLNSASLTVIAVAMKLPMDLNNLMPGYIDQAAKLGSLGFMCTMMANLLPSLATMDTIELVSNMIALGVLIITLVVNVCIQINTGVLSFHGVVESGLMPMFRHPKYAYVSAHRFIAIIYVGVLLMLLMIYACSSLAILKCRQILESKYQMTHESTSKDDQELQWLSVEKSKKHDFKSDYVEESLNATNDHVSIQKAAKTLWLEVEVYHKWLGNKLTKPGLQENTARQILRNLSNTAKNIVDDMETIDIGRRNDNSIHKFISANSMYRITETIMLSYHIDLVSQEELFAQLSSMITDILAACLTNLPQVISVKCHASAIEKREASVHVAARLLGETMQIINTLQDRQLPSLNLDELGYIEKWRAYLLH